jgi:hypothetical protein
MWYAVPLGARAPSERSRGAEDPIPEAEGETVSKKEKKDKRKQTKRKEKKAERNPK